LPKLKPYKYRELVRKLREFDPRFEVYTRKGKGSHRMLYHPDIGGKSESFPLICHGEDTEIAKYYIKDIIRRFKLPEGIL
jgi:predicted RNA binding protein YcfA (HicA-like mRNA interferase family)